MSVADLLLMHTAEYGFEVRDFGRPDDDEPRFRRLACSELARRTALAAGGNAALAFAETHDAGTAEIAV